MILRQTQTIPTPWTQRVHRLRRSLLPSVSFVACILLALWLWNRQGQLPHTLGEVEAVRIEVAAAADGILAPLPRGPWVLFDRVEADAMLARLDDRAVLAEMATLQAELAKLRSDLVAGIEQIALDEVGRAHDYNRESRRLAWQVQQHRLDLLDRRAVIESDRAELARLDSELTFLEPLLARGTVPELQVMDLRLQRDRVRKRIHENEQALTEAEKQHGDALAMLRSYPEIHTASVDKLLEPLKVAITVGERKLDALQVQLEALEVRAPFSGTLCAINAWPGQQVRAGDPLFSLAAEHGRYIVSYVRQEQRIRPAVGMQVTLRSRSERGPSAESVVERVGPQVELVPVHHLRDQKLQEWGQPVCIQPPPQLTLRPGELIDVTFHRQAGPPSL